MRWPALYLFTTRTRLSGVALLFFAALQIAQCLNAQDKPSLPYRNNRKPLISESSGKITGRIQAVSSQSIKVANHTFKLTQETQYRSVRNKVETEASRDDLKRGLTVQVAFTLKNKERLASKVSIIDCDCNTCLHPKKCDCCNA